MLNFLIILLHICLILNLVLLVRNEYVCNYRIKLLNKISDLTQKDINDIDNIKNKKYDWKWRYNVFGSVSYNKMWILFWKRLKPENFYKDLSFLKEGVKYDNK